MKKIKNTFIDIILLGVSFIFSLGRSLVTLFSKKKGVKRSSFFDVFDYIFRVWPQEFWKKPTGYKIGIFFAGLLKYIFYKNKK